MLFAMVIALFSSHLPRRDEEEMNEKKTTSTKSTATTKEQVEDLGARKKCSVTIHSRVGIKAIKTVLSLFSVALLLLMRLMLTRVSQCHALVFDCNLLLGSRRI